MLEKLRRFRALDLPAQKLFLCALAMLPAISLSLRWTGFKATQAMLRELLPASPTEQNSDAVDERLALTSRMINAADRHGPVHPSCLVKSLTLWWLLERQGIQSQLRIGIRKEKDGFEAHAWVERKGVALNEPEERHRHYAAFDAAFAGLPKAEL